MWHLKKYEHISHPIFSDCMGMNLSCISGLLLPTICTAYPRKSLQNQQTQLSFKNSWLIPWIYAMTYCVKITTSRYFKEFKNIFNKNVISTINTQHCNLRIILQLFTIHISLLLVTYHSELNHALLFKNRGCSKNSQNTSISFKCLVFISYGSLTFKMSFLLCAEIPTWKGKSPGSEEINIWSYQEMCWSTSSFGPGLWVIFEFFILLPCPFYVLMLFK